MLDQRAPDEHLHDIILGGDGPAAAGRRAVDRLVDFSLARVDVVDGVLLAGEDVHPPPIVGGEARLLGAAGPGVLDFGEDVGVGEGEVRERGLGDEVEAARGQDAPEQVSVRQGDAVGAGGLVALARAVPLVDQLAVVGGDEVGVGADDGRVEEAAERGARGEVDGEEGARRGLVGQEGDAAGAEGVVDAHVVRVHAVVVERGGDDVRADQRAGRLVEAHDLCAPRDGVAAKAVVGDPAVDDPQLADRVEDDVLHVHETCRCVLGGGAVLDRRRGPWLLAREARGDDDVVRRISVSTRVREVEVLLGIDGEARRGLSALMDGLQRRPNEGEVLGVGANRVVCAERRGGRLGLCKGGMEGKEEDGDGGEEGSHV